MGYHPSVLLHAGPGGDQLADDDVLLQPDELVAPALDGRLGEHPGGLLEGSRREPRVGRQRRLGDAHELGAPLGGTPTLGHQHSVRLGEQPLVDLLAGQEVRLAGVVDLHPPGHLPHDQLDVLVVDGHALVPVDLLDLLHEVLLGLADALDLQELLGVAGPFDDGVAGPDLLTVRDLQAGHSGHCVDLLGAVVGNHGYLTTAPLVLADPDHAGDACQGCLALRCTGLEELHDPREAAGEVLADHAAGVEGTHGQLGAGLADRLGCDHAHRLADLDVLAGGQRHAVAGGRHAGGRVVRQGRQDADPVHVGVVAHELHLDLADDGAGNQDPATALRRGVDDALPLGIGDHDLVGQGSAEQAGLQVEALVLHVGAHTVDPDATDRALGLERIGVVDDELLGDVDQATGQVAGVGGTQGGVDEALTGTGRGDEVLQHRKALTEVRLDRPRDHVATRVGHQAAHAGDLAHLHHVPTGTGLDHHVDRVGLVRLESLDHPCGHLRGGRVPDLDLLLATLTVGDDAPSELGFDLLGVLLVAFQDLDLGGRCLDVIDRHGEAGPAGVLEADVLEGVQAIGHHLLGVVAGQVVDYEAQFLLVDLSVDEGDRLAGKAADPDRGDGLAGHGVVEDDPAGRRGVPCGGRAVGRRVDQFRVLVGPVLDAGVKVHDAALHGPAEVVQVTEDLALAGQALDLGRQVVGTDDHVLGRGDKGSTVGWAENVVGRQHQDPGLGLGLRRQWQVDGHLVTVEVGVEGRADERVDADGLALHQHRLEGLDAQPVQGGSAVQQHRVLADDVLQDGPDLGLAPLDHALGRLDVLGQLIVDQLLHDERLEQLECHDLGQAALVELERRAGHDDRTARVVDALSEQVLAEPALLALQHVGQGLERTVARSGHGTTPSTVVEQGVDGLLEHPLLVVHDDAGSPQVEKALQPVVPVDDPAVQVVQVGGGEAATIQLDHRTQLRRDDRDDVQDHCTGLVHPATVLVAAVECGHDLEALDGLLLALGTQRLLTLRRIDHRPELHLFVVEVDAIDQPGQCSGAHATLEVLAPAILQLAPEHVLFDDLAGKQAGELVPGPVEHVELLLVLLPDELEVLVGSLGPGLEVGLPGALRLHLGQFGLEVLLATVQLAVALLLDGEALLGQLGLQFGKVLVALALVDPDDKVGGEIDDLLQLLGLELLARLGTHEQVCEPGPGSPEVPDVDGRCGQLDVAHAVPSDLGAGDLHPTPLTDDPLEADPLVLAAVALPVLGRAEDLLAEEPVLLRLQGAVVDGLRLLDLAVGPHADAVRGGQADADLIEFVDVEHCFFLRLVLGVVRVSGRGRQRGARHPRRNPARGGTGRCRVPRQFGRRPRRSRASRSRDHSRRVPPRSGRATASP